MKRQTAKVPGGGRVAIVVPHSGQPTETFIRRYAEKLDPGNVVMVHFYHGADAWGLDAPTYFPERAFGGSRLLAKAWRGAQKLAGIESLFGDSYMAGSLKKFLRQNGVTAVFSQYLVAGATVQELVGSLGLRHVVRGLGYDVSSALEEDEWRMRYRVLESADAIVVPTAYQTERLRGIGLKRVPIHHFPCCVELPEAALRNGGGGKVRFLAVGRMVAKKAPLLLLKAFEIAARECPGIELTMVGGGPLFEEAKAHAAGSPLAGSLRLLGPLPHAEMLGLFHEADVFVQHSMTDPATGDQEGMPVVILEAMARGLPIVSTLHAGIPHVVEHGGSGLLTREGDAAAMAESIKAIAKDEEMRVRMGKAARARVADFSWEKEKSLLRGLLQDGGLDAGNQANDQS